MLGTLLPERPAVGEGIETSTLTQRQRPTTRTRHPRSDGRHPGPSEHLANATTPPSNCAGRHRHERTPTPAPTEGRRAREPRRCGHVAMGIPDRDSMPPEL